MLINIIKKSSFPTVDDSADYLDELWLDTSVTPNILKQYNSSIEEWENVAFKDIININDNSILNVWKGTKEEFELLDILKDNVIYFVANIGVFIGNSPIFKTDKIVYVNPRYEGNRRLGASWDFPFGDLQDAINAANNGDTIWLAKGTYKSDGYQGVSFTCDKRLTLIGGFEGTETTIYDRRDINGTIFTGEGIRSIIKVTANNVVFDSIEFQNGNINKNGGAIYNEINTNTTIKRCKFFNNNAILGGAIYNPYIVIDSLFVSNKCTGNGNAIYLDKFAKIVGNTFVGGITNSCVYSTTNIEFVNNIIWNKNVGGDSIVYNPEGSTIANDASTIKILGNDCILISRTNAGTDEGVNYAKFKSPGENNYQLSDDSDLIGKGNPNYCLTEFDMDLKPRIIGNNLDLGCYENQSRNGLINVKDIEGLDKNAVGLGNVDNTSDADKPISDATAAALGTIRNSLNGKADLVNGVIPVTQIPSALIGDLKFGGVWDAFDNIPHLINGDYTTAGTYYIANTEGIQFGFHFYSGDYCINDAGVWKKIGRTDGGVKSINGKTGVVELTITDIPDLATELESKANALQTQQALNNKADLVNGVVPITQLPPEALKNIPYLGVWDASTNTPTLVTGEPSLNCKYYRVSTMGTWNNILFHVNDLVINLNGRWYKITGEIASNVEQQQADWEQTDDTAPSFIKHKPNLDVYCHKDTDNVHSDGVTDTFSKSMYDENGPSTLLQMDRLTVGGDSIKFHHSSYNEDDKEFSLQIDDVEKLKNLPTGEELTRELEGKQDVIDNLDAYCRKDKGNQHDPGYGDHYIDQDWDYTQDPPTVKRVLRTSIGGLGVLFQILDDQSPSLLLQYEEVKKLIGLPTATEITEEFNSKQDTINDLVTIRSGAQAGSTAYQKPTDGIPASDLASDVPSLTGHNQFTGTIRLRYNNSDVGVLINNAGVSAYKVGYDNHTSCTLEDIGLWYKVTGKNVLIGVVFNGDTPRLVVAQNGVNPKSVAFVDDLQSFYTKPSSGIPATDLELAIQTLLNAIPLIQGVIPAQATDQNQLADKNFVNSSIATNTANYISDNGQPFQSLTDLEAYSGVLTNNDYAFVVGVDSAGNTTYSRYKYNSSTQQWALEYVLNNSSFTAEQWASISSGITSGLVTKLSALPTNSELTTSLNSKVDKVNGKGLSTEDYTTAEKTKLGDLPTNTELTTLLNGKANTADLANKENWDYAGDEFIVTARKTFNDIVVPKADVNPYGTYVLEGIEKGEVTMHLFCYNGDMTKKKVVINNVHNDVTTVLYTYELNYYETLDVNVTLPVDTGTLVFENYVLRNVWQVKNIVNNYVSHRSLSDYARLADLASVATSGSYNDLSNRPDLSGFITKSVDDLTYYYTKSEIDTMIGNIETLLAAI